MSHPYADLPAAARWRAAVARTDPAAPDGIWTPGFTLTPDAVFATAGSCFAQHVGRALRAAGLTLADAEPAPATLPPRLAAEHGYGLFSARCGNVYTARQMAELLAEAATGTPDPRLIWTRDGRFRDALRPGVDPLGLDSAEEVLALRRDHLTRLAAMLPRVTHFIFTLGLTEGWQDAETGRALPVCPGVVAGRFDPARHRFTTARYPQILDDLAEIRGRLRRFNPAMRLILTVSPVPLSATASGGHVLPATTASKATLRAAAGDFAADHPDVDYFPAYEIVTNPAAGSRFYEPNLRDIRPEGVAAVMGAFFAGLGLTMPAETAEPPPQPPSEAASYPHCEEALLDALHPTDNPA
ncbi:MAG: GSCFA domain-containing protein [Paracoccus sp. (in: a-proteobacteria)]|nr:GSCFA domain-containing protein [Paracoccus sp. (in: a-proteobacteria)]